MPNYQRSSYASKHEGDNIHPGPVFTFALVRFPVACGFQSRAIGSLEVLTCVGHLTFTPHHIEWNTTWAFATLTTSITR